MKKSKSLPKLLNKIAEENMWEEKEKPQSIKDLAEGRALENLEKGRWHRMELFLKQVMEGEIENIEIKDPVESKKGALLMELVGQKF